MALEALVILPTHDRDDYQRAGDILVIALAGHPWSDKERKLFQVIDYTGDDEAELEAKVRAANGPIAYPFAEFEDVPARDGEPGGKRMKAISTKAVDVSAVPNKGRAVDQPRAKIARPTITTRGKR